MSTSTIRCPLCDNEARLVTVQKEVTAGRRRVTVEDEFMQCDTCDEAFYTPEQSARLESAVREKLKEAENLLEPPEYARIRNELGFTQAQFDELLGVGPKSSARWETGRVRPNITTDRLIRLLAANPENVRILAAINGVTVLPPAMPVASWAPQRRLYALWGEQRAAESMEQLKDYFRDLGFGRRAVHYTHLDLKPACLLETGGTAEEEMTQHSGTYRAVLQGAMQRLNERAELVNESPSASLFVKSGYTWGKSVTE